VGATELSVIIPTFNAARVVVPLIEDLAALPVHHEVIVADGGSTDATCEVAFRLGAFVVKAPLGRGAQLAAGAARAHADLLCFLDPDTRLGPRALLMIERLVRARPKGAYAFRLRIATTGLGYRMAEWGANARSRWARLPGGNQGLIVWREDYERAGGFPALPLLEDVALVRALSRVTRVRTLPATLTVSAARWGDRGALRTAAREWMHLTAYLAGASPERIAGTHRVREDVTTGDG
jgi:rSAM/selenodomain-associated transferase 2